MYQVKYYRHPTGPREPYVMQTTLWNFRNYEEANRSVLSKSYHLVDEVTVNGMVVCVFYASKLGEAAIVSLVP